jgi:Coenzyme PQQ synthesis protein D (PqqD)
MTARKTSKRKPTGSVKRKRSGGLDRLILERSDTVLWTIAPPGIVLHNFACRKYIQLDKTGYIAWGLLDGARTVREVIDRCAANGSSEKRRRVRGIVRTLADNGFLVGRTHA